MFFYIYDGYPDLFISFKPDIKAKFWEITKKYFRIFFQNLDFENVGPASPGVNLVEATGKKYFSTVLDFIICGIRKCAEQSRALF